MFLSYGNINLKIVRLLLCQREAQYDATGIDYLYTKWRISVEAIYTPTTGINIPYTVATKQTNPANVPYGPTLTFPPSQYSPIITDASLRHALMQPRQKLLLSYGSNTEPGDNEGSQEYWLVSPTNNTFTTDMNNGPLPIECSVEEVRGEGGLFLVRYTIETAVNECGVTGGQIPFLLSNRYTVSTTTDENFFETRTFKGEAIFRADIVNAITGTVGINAYRLNILPPMPVFCKRYIDNLSIMPDGYTISYLIRDVEEEVAYLDEPTYLTGTSIGRTKRNVTSIDAVVQRAYERKGSSDVVSSLINEIRASTQAMGMFSQLQKQGSVVKKGMDALGGADTSVAMDTAFILASTTLNTTTTLLPTFTERVVCEVRGNRFSKKRDLQMLAFSVAFGQLTDVNAAAIQNNGANPALSALVGGVGASGGPAGPPLNAMSPGQKAGEYTDLILQNQIASTFGVLLPNTLGTSLLRGALSLVPTAHVIKLEYDVFKKRVKVEVEQSVSGLVDFIGLRTASGRAALYNGISDNVFGGNWPAFFTASPTGFADWVGIFGQNGTPFMPNPPTPLPDNLLLIGTLSPQAAGIGPPLDNTAYTGTLLQMIAAQLQKPCQQVLYPNYNTLSTPGVPLSSIPLTTEVLPIFKTSPPQQPSTV